MAITKSDERLIFSNCDGVSRPWVKTCFGRDGPLFAGFATLRRLTAIGQRGALSKLDVLGWVAKYKCRRRCLELVERRRSRDGTWWRVRDGQTHISGLDGFQLKKTNDIEKWKNALTGPSGYGSQVGYIYVS